jgi:hypothetical protein
MIVGVSKLFNFSYLQYTRTNLTWDERELYEFAQCTLQVLNVGTVRHTAHIRCRVTAPVYIMATPEHKAFCVLQLSKRNSLVEHL